MASFKKHAAVSKKTMKGLRIRPDKSGLQATLFDLEATIMEIVWSEGWVEFSVSDVHLLLEKERDIAYTTVMTTVSRLFDKGLLLREKEGRRYLYKPAMGRSDFIEVMTREVLQSLPPVGQQTAMTLLVEHVAKANDAELDHLELLIQRRRGKSRE